MSCQARSSVKLKRGWALFLHGTSVLIHAAVVVAADVGGGFGNQAAKEDDPEGVKQVQGQVEVQASPYKLRLQKCPISQP